MKRKIIAILILLPVLGALSYWGYKRLGTPKANSIYELIPENALLAYETSRAYSVFPKIQESNLWHNLRHLPSCKNLVSDIHYLDSVAAKQIGLKQVLKDNPVLTSLHVTGKASFGSVFYIELKNTKDHQQAKHFIQHFNDNERYKHNTRSYKNTQIHEITDKRNQKQFSYFTHQNYFIGSFTSFLLEDVVRNKAEKFEQNFYTNNPGLFQLSKIKEDEGNLYFNYKQTSSFLNTFLEGNYDDKVSKLKHFGNGGFFDVKVTDNYLLLNGTSLLKKPSQKDSTFLGTFNNIAPSSFTLPGFLPGRTSSFFHISADNMTKWVKNVHAFQNYHYKENADFLKKRANLANRVLQQNKEWLSWAGDELGLALMESVNQENNDKIIIIKAKDTTRALEEIKQITEVRTKDSMLVEKFGGYAINEIKYNELFKVMLGPLFSGFGQCFYIKKDNYFIFGNTTRVLKDLIEDDKEENTWNKSVDINRFLENTLDKANLTVVSNNNRLWNSLQGWLSNDWRQMLEKNAFLINNFQMASLQFSPESGSYYTSFALKTDKSYLPDNEGPQWKEIGNLQHQLAFTSKPYTVRNHETGELEVFAQDEGKYLHKLNPQSSEMVWQDSLGEKIVSDFDAIDYYKNGKCQYLFATNKNIYVKDKNGKNLSGFPFMLPDSSKIEFMTLVDYDNTKDYRFMAANKKGEVFIFNKKGENLKGWRPRSFDKSLAIPPYHIRVRGRDLMVAIQEHGKISIVNRRGQFYNGFPINLKSQFSGPVFNDLGDNLKTSHISTVSNNGELIKWNLVGEIEKRKQLYKPSSDTYFELCVDELGKTFLIARQDYSRLSILDADGNMLFEKNYISQAALKEGKLGIQYYHFGAGNAVIAVTDKVQDFTYFYDRSGNLLMGQPFESSSKIGLMFFDQEGMYKIYRIYMNEFGVLTYRTKGS